MKTADLEATLKRWPALGTAAHDCEAANAEPSASKFSFFSCSPLALYKENTGWVTSEWDRRGEFLSEERLQADSL